MAARKPKNTTRIRIDPNCKAMEIRTDTCTVIADADEIHFYGPDASHWCTVRAETAVDLVAATDAILESMGRPSFSAGAKAWEQRAANNLLLATIGWTFAGLGWLTAIGSAVAAKMWL